MSDRLRNFFYFLALPGLLGLASIPIAPAQPVAAQGELPPPANDLVFAFDDFASTEPLIINGRASQIANPVISAAGDSVLELTELAQNQVSSVFWPEPVSVTQSWSSEISFQIPATARGGADGFSLLLAGDPFTLSSPGGYLGYLDVPSSVAIEFDTYQNTWDESENHIGISLDGDVGSTVEQPVTTGDFEDGSVWTAWVDFDVASSQLSVSVSPTGNRPATPDLATVVDVAETVGGESAYFGITGASGGAAWSQHYLTSWSLFTDVLEFTVDAGPDQNALEGTTVTLDGSASIDPNAPSTATYKAAVLGDGAGFYWPFDEAEGGVANDVVGSINGSIAGAQWSDDAAVASGTGSLSFDGNDYVSLGRPEELKLDEFTFETWFREQPGSTGADFMVRSRTFGYAVYTANGQLGVYYFTRDCGFPNNSNTTSAQVDDGEWHHVAFSYGPEAVVLYLDGVPVLENPGETNLGYCGNGWAFGRDGDRNANFWLGDLDEVAIYPSALSQEQVEQHFCVGTGECVEPAGVKWELLSADGPPIQLSSTTDLNPTFFAPDDGVYTFRLTASDGLQSASDVVTVRVNNADPVIEATATPSASDGAVLVTTSFTDPGSLDTHEVILDWGDGSTPQRSVVPVQGTGWGAVSAAHVYAEPGSYTATITLVDDDQGTTETEAVIDITVGGTVRPVPGIALWSNGSADADDVSELRLAGRDLAANGRANTNDALVINGDSVSITSAEADDLTAVGETTETGRNHDAALDPAAVSTPPVGFNIADYQPGGRAALAAGAQFIDLTASCEAGGTEAVWAPTGTIDPGLYWSPCAVDLAGSTLVAEQVTIASSSPIRVSGAGHEFSPFIDSVSLITSSPDTDETPAVKISGDSHDISGVVLALAGELRVSGIDTTFDCGAFGNTVLVTGQGHRFNQNACVASDPGAPSLIPVVAPAIVAPTLLADIDGSAATVNPGGDVVFTGTVTNTGATVAIPGLAQIGNPRTTPVTITDASATLEVLDVVSGEWRTLSEGSSTSTRLAAIIDGTTDNDTSLAGSVVAPNATLVAGVSALFDLNPAQLTELADTAIVSDARIVVTVETDPAASALEVDLRLDPAVVDGVQGDAADIAELVATLQGSSGAAETITAATLAPGESATATLSAAAPTVGERQPGESNAAFINRLETIDGAVVAASLSGNASSSVGPLPVVGGFDAATVRLPIVSASLTAPTSTRQADDITVDVSFTNTGSVPATLAGTLSETVLGDITIPGIPSTLAAGETFTAAVDVPVPADRTANLNLSLNTAWQGSGVDLDLAPIIKLVEVLEPANLLVTKTTDVPPGITPGNVAYQIAVLNTGDDPVTGVTLVDAPTPEFPLVDGTLTTSRGTATVNPDGSGFSVDIGELVAGDAALIDYELNYADTPNSVTAFTNQAVVSSNELPDVLSDDPSVDGVADPTVFTFRGGMLGNGVIGWFGDPDLSGGVFTPADGSVITEPTVIGIDFAQVEVPEGRTIESWRLTATPYEASTSSIGLGTTEIANGTGQPGAALATFDPTQLANGIYKLQVEMTDSTGATGVVWIDVTIDGNLKLGRFSLTYQDMNVPVGGIPLQLLRTYDTLDRTSSDDFGFGWTLDIADFDVRTNGELGFAGWTQFSCGGGFIFTELCYEGTRPHYVTVTWPNGQVESFDFTPQGTSSFFAGQAIADYTARDGRTTSTLSPAPGDSTAFYDSATGNIRAGGFGEGGIYDPQRWVLTDRNGTQYVLDRDDGLVEAIDRNGNTVTVTDDGIFSSQGPSIQFDRDDDGRIAEATGPDGESVSYTYDLQGDLRFVADQKGDVTGFGYGSDGDGSTHYLSEIDDPGAGPQRTLTYDEDGRLVSATDAEGNVTAIDVDPDARTEIVTSPDGLLTTISSFDARGNAVSVNEVYDGTNHVSTFVFDDMDQPVSRTDPNGTTWTGTYDDDRNLLGFSDGNGDASSFSYDEFGFPTSVTDANGDQTQFRYDTRGNLVTIVDARGNTQAFTYDGDGNQLTRTDQINRTWTWVYTSASLVSTATDPRGNTTGYAYDGQGRLASMTAADGGVTSYSYDDVGNLTRATDPLGRATNYVYDSRDRLTSMTDASGAVTSYGYDDNDRLVSMTDPTSRTWTYAYAFDRLATETAPDGGVTSYAYDGAGRVDAITDPLNRTTRYVYDEAGRRTQTVRPIGDGGTATSTVTLDGNGRAVVRTNAEGEATNYVFDPVGRLTLVTDPIGRTTSYAFDAVGNRTGMTNGEGETSAWVYNPANELITATNAEGETTTYTYDAAGNLATVTDPLDRVTTYGYDAVNRQNSVTLPSGDSGSTVFNAAGEVVTSTSPAGYATSFTYELRGLMATAADALGNTVANSYDAAGRRITVTDARGNDSTYAYDPVGRVESETDPLGGTIEFGYDLAGQRTSVTDANDATRTFGFDDGGRMITATDALDRTTTYSFDDVGRRTGMVDARGVAVSSVFDDAGQLTQRVSPSETQTFSYDGAGRRTGFTDITGNTTMVFDDAGRLVEVAAPAGTVTYGYNAAGERTSMSQPDGALSYAYDVNGHLSALTDWRTDSVSYVSDADGRTLTMERSNGVDTTYGYDTAGRLDAITHDGPAGVIDTFDYTLDGNGNRTAVTNTAGTETYVLDALNRLTSASYADGTTETFGYDPQGNRTSATDRDGNTTTYVVDATGQLVSDSDGTSYVYDQAGNLVSTSLGDAYEWDDYGRLIETTVDGDTETYGYDATSVRTLVGVDEQLWDRTGLPTLINDGTTSFVHDGNGVLRSDDWLLTDAVGSVRNTTSETGAVTGSSGFTAFGEPISSADTFGFAGEQTDATGLVHLRARQLDPALGRFLSVDPIQPGGPSTTGWNHYTYAGANPTTWTDPTGMLNDSVVTYQPSSRVGPALRTFGTAVGVLLLKTALAYTAIECTLEVTSNLWPTGDGGIRGLCGAVSGAGDAITGGAGGESPVPTVDVPSPYESLARDYGVAEDDIRNCHRNGRGSSFCEGLPEELLDLLEGIVPCNLNCFGNRTRPRPPRPGIDIDIDESGFVHPTDQPAGASSFGDAGEAPLSGHYWVLPEGTQLPDGLGVIPDGSDVGGPQGATHHTIFPTRPMPYEEFAELFDALPWEYGGKK